MARSVTEIPAAVALFDRDCRYAAASAEWIAAFGLVCAPLAGQAHAELCRSDPTALDAVLQRALAGEAVDNYPLADDGAGQGSWHGTLGARPYRDGDGVVAGAIVVAQVLVQREPAQPDAAAGLAERNEFIAHLRAALAGRDPEHGATVVFAINLDGFRSVNALHGVAIGDRVLEVTAERLISGTRSRLSGEGASARENDVVARLGADEFGIVCGAPALPPTEAEALAARLLRIVQNPIAIGPHSLRLTASIGFVIATPAQHDENDVLRDLNLALQQAKSLGPNRAVAWQPAVTAAATRRYSLAEQLRRAYDSGEFMLHYQPVLRLSDNRMVGAEALLCWNHASEGLVSSAAFVPVLEEMGLIVEVGCWVIREAVRQIESWRMLYGRDIIDWVSVNLSARQFADPAPLLATLRAIYDSGFAVNRLKLDISETTFMRSPEITATVLAELRALGMRIAIDDFGTAYSSLDRLRHYPVDTIKIDGEFVAQIGTAEGEKLARALLDLARIFGAAILAEGIETEAQREFLCGAGCGFGQGYLFAEPMAGALLGAYALTHAVTADRGPPSIRSPGRTLNPPTSAGPLRAG